MVLEIISVYFYRNKRLIFDNFNLKLKKSQIMILIGGNGAGKTSLFDLVVGVLEPMKGIIKIDKTPVMDLDSKKRITFTYLGHKDCLKENLTIEENIMNWVKISGKKFEKPKIEKILKYFGLQDIKNSLVGNLSQGQRKKVSLSKLVFNNNKLWLLDEPFNGLDNNSIKKTIMLIEKHSKTGGSILLANHINIDINNSKKIFIKSKKTPNIDHIQFDKWDYMQ